MFYSLNRLLTCMLLIHCAFQSEIKAGIITTSEDTFITLHSGLGGSSSTHGDDEVLSLISPLASFQATPLLNFDLSHLAGTTINSSVDLVLTVTATHASLVGSSVTTETHSNVRLYKVLTAWEEDTLSWETFGASPGAQAGTDYDSTALFAQTITLGVGDTLNISLPTTLIQSWIDAPSSNYGLILISGNNTFDSDIHFGSRETSVSGAAPRLVSDDFMALTNTVPEPASIALFGLGSLGCSFFVRRRRKS